MAHKRVVTLRTWRNVEPEHLQRLGCLYDRIHAALRFSLPTEAVCYLMAIDHRISHS